MPPNPMAQAWLAGGTDLGIWVMHPFTFTTRTGIPATTQGVFLPDFGSHHGTVLLCRFDPVQLDALLSDTNYFRSALNLHRYEPYTRDLYIETLNDWGWYGPSDRTPSWFTGTPWA